MRRVMTSTPHTPEPAKKELDPIDRLIELLAKIEVERYLAEIENGIAEREDAERKSGDLRKIQR